MHEVDLLSLAFVILKALKQHEFSPQIPLLPAPSLSKYYSDLPFLFPGSGSGFHMSTDAVPPFLPACSFKAHWLGRLLEHSPIALLNAECLLAYWQAVARCLGWLRKLQFAIMDGRDAAESIKNGAGYDTSLGPRGENGAGSESVYSCSNPAIANISTPTGSHSISISMPSSPTALVVAKSNSVFSNDKTWTEANNAPSLPQRAHTKFHSQPMHVGFASANKSEQCFPRKQRLDDEKRFNLFKTWSGRFESRLSNMHIKSCDQVRIDDSKCREADILPAIDRYFDALEGPELETLKACEKLVLPKNKEWPFLLRFPINSFGMCLGLGSQAIMWKTLASSPSLSFLNISPNVNLVLWCIALALTALMAMIYSLKIIFFFEAVKREYYHPVRINFFFAPWISCLFLAIGIPPHVSTNLHTSLWYILMAPILCLEVKIYGQWMSGNRRLSKVANPSNHLSIVGNFVGALLGASMGIKEGPVFFFAIGLAHYIVLFVTLYQRLPTTETLPKELHPVFFLFIAAPSVACTSWAKITGKFDMGSRIAYFTAMFLYASLAVRINFFRGFRFSLAWWAYTFPMTGAAIATICYTDEVNSEITKTLAIVLSVVSTVAVSTLLISTTLHAFVLRNLFPNDIAIAITYKRTKSRKKNSRNRAPSSVVKGIEVCVSKDSPVL